MSDALQVPRPNGYPVTLLSLYRIHTGDKAASEGEVKRLVAGDSHKRRQAISLYLKGYTQAQIAAALAINPGSVSDRIHQAFWRVYKALHAVPRHHKTGRGGGQYAVVVAEGNESLNIVSAHTNARAAEGYLYRAAGEAFVARVRGGRVFAGDVWRGEWEVVRGPVKRRVKA